jgi:hypothetical protein
LRDSRSPFDCPLEASVRVVPSVERRKRSPTICDWDRRPPRPNESRSVEHRSARINCTVFRIAATPRCPSSLRALRLSSSRRSSNLPQIDGDTPIMGNADVRSTPCNSFESKFAEGPSNKRALGESPASDFTAVGNPCEVVVPHRVESGSMVSRLKQQEALLKGSRERIPPLLHQILTGARPMQLDAMIRDQRFHQRMATGPIE